MPVSSSFLSQRRDPSLPSPAGTTSIAELEQLEGLTADGRNELAAEYYSALTDMVTNDAGRPQAKHAADFLAKRTR